MIAVLAGLGAAASWAVATLCSSRSSRMASPVSVLAAVMVVGLVITLPFGLASGLPGHLNGMAWGWLLLAGAGNVAGLLLEYAALSIGKVGVVAPIASTEGAIAAVISVVAGEHLAAGTAVLLGVIAVGVSLAAMAPDVQDVRVRRLRRSALLAGASSMMFGASIYATGRVSQLLPVIWAVLPARVIGVGFVAVPLALAGRLRLPHEAAPLVGVAGVMEVAGFLSYAVAARHGIAVAAVLGAQFAALSAVAAFFLFRERLARLQLAGVATTLIGVAVLTGLRA